MAARQVEDEAGLAAIVRQMHTIAVVGMKDERRRDEPAFSVPAALAERGYVIVPVNPMIEAALGQPAHARLADVAVRCDLVNVFRRSDALPELVDQILALPHDRRPAVVWLQSGIRHDAAAARLVAAGIDVVQDRCLGVYAARTPRPAP